MTTLTEVLNPRIVPLPQRTCATGKVSGPNHRTAAGGIARNGGNGRPQSALDPIPLKWVTLQLYSASSGYSVGALRQKIRRGHFAEGLHFRKAPDGRVLINVEACQNWGGAK